MNIIIIIIQHAFLVFQKVIIAIVPNLKQQINVMKIVKHAKKEEMMKIIIVRHVLVQVQNFLIQEIVKKVVNMTLLLMELLKHVNVQVILVVFFVLKKVMI